MVLGKTLTVLLLLTSGCSAMEQWTDLQMLEHQLLTAETDQYLPGDFARWHESRRNLIREARRSTNPIILTYKRPFLESRLEWDVVQGHTLLTRSRVLREKLQKELEGTIAGLRNHLAETRAYLYYPELHSLLSEIRTRLERTGSFLEPGTYAENLVRLRELSDSVSELQKRWRRYNGGFVAPSDVERQISEFERLIDPVKPTGYYIVIDTALNRLYLRNADRTVLEAVCSTGSGHKLVARGNEWVFETPRGEFSVQRKIEDPIWRKPDWAFIEAGESVPRREAKRLEKSALGEFALAIGNGYFIHGTPYTRLLGDPVSHGCIRLASRDLVRLARLVDIGTKVYIF